MDATDLDAVSRWVSERMPGFQSVERVEKFSGGQSNPTYRLITPAGRYVLRRKPPGMLLKSAHAVDREFRVQKALQDTGVPVAKMHVLCEDDSVIGSAFYIMDEVGGRNFDDPRLPGLPGTDRDALMDEMNRVLAAIHDVDIAATGLSDYGPAGNYYERQLARWSRQYHATLTDDLPDMAALMVWLGRNMPEEDGQLTLVHGDYRLDNLLFDADGTACAAVLDWELSTLGHPYADLAGVVMQWSMPPGRVGRGLAGVDRAGLGLWPDQQFIDTYCQRRKIPPIAGFNFYLAFCYFRMAAILQGVKKRALDGNASDPKRGLRLGAYVPEFARAGLEAARHE